MDGSSIATLRPASVVPWTVHPATLCPVKRFILGNMLNNKKLGKFLEFTYSITSTACVINACLITKKNSSLQNVALLANVGINQERLD